MLFRKTSLVGLALLASCALSTASWSMGMKDAVKKALATNPEIGEAIANRAAIEFELEQGMGLYRPRIDLQASAGIENRDNDTTRANNDQDRLFLRREASVVISQTLFDGGAIRSEVERQASRIDGASYRVKERTEFIALAVIREYLEMGRLRRIIQLSQDNIAYHQRILGEIAQGTGGGTISVADRQQAQERVFAARAALEDWKEQLKASEAAFIRLVGQPVGKLEKTMSTKDLIPASIDQALQRAKAHHPSIKFAQADVDASAALVRGAEAKFSPKFSLEGRASAGQDVGGVDGFDGDLQANVVMNWNLYNGGIDAANKQEQIRHVDESYHRLHRITREVEEGVRLSWDRHVQQTRRLRELLRELSTIEQLRGSYLDQFRIGERSLLDLLDTQNTRYSVQVAVATADTAVKFGHFRILASTGDLLKTLGFAQPEEAKAYARDWKGVPESPTPDSYERVEPVRP